MNNAGVFGEREGWELAMEINLTAVVRGSSLAIQKMAKRKGGSVHMLYITVDDNVGVMTEKFKSFSFSSFNFQARAE